MNNEQTYKIEWKKQPVGAVFLAEAGEVNFSGDEMVLMANSTEVARFTLSQASKPQYIYAAGDPARMSFVATDGEEYVIQIPGHTLTPHRGLPALEAMRDHYAQHGVAIAGIPSAKSMRGMYYVLYIFVIVIIVMSVAGAMGLI